MNFFSAIVTVCIFQYINFKYLELFSVRNYEGMTSAEQEMTV